jgi:poly-gamma-glutamate synthesis protein (capsule biosynthesis protein)
MPSPWSFNWKQGAWSNPDSAPPDLTICVAGDWAPIRKFRSAIENSPTAVYGDLLPTIQSADLSIVNLEAPLSDGGQPVVKSGSVFKGEKKHVAGLAAVPFDVVTLANNHVFDYGPEAFQDSLRVLGENHIKYTGAGMTAEAAARPLVLDIRGVRIGIVNFCEGEDLTCARANRPGVMGWDLVTVCDTITNVKRQVDVVLVISHCGIEYIPFPPPYVASAFKQAAEAGADMVLGHHPHVPQGISFHHATPICYSLGNFVFYQETDLKYRKLGYMVKIGISRHALASIELVPYSIGEQGLSALKDQQLDDFFKRLKEISLPLDTPEALEASWNGYLQYYGTSGFFKEISMILDHFEGDPQKGAAMLRNRLTTLQHFHHWKDLMTRIVDGKLETASGWARDLTHQWLTTKLEAK